MKKLRVITLMLLLPTFLFAANGMEKVGPRLKMLLKNSNLGKNTSLAKAAQKEYLNVFLRGEANAVKAAVEANGGHVNTVIGDILTAQIPKNSVLDIARLSAVQRIKLGFKIKAHSEEAVKHMRADKVHAGEAPLAQGYTGEGVIVGILDTGIDWKHAAFRDPADTTKSRILSIWDQEDDTGTKPAGLSYGSEWTRAQIEDEIDGIPAGVVNHRDNLPGGGGHGTHVSGIAAGNKGLAPGADIIVVALNFGSSTGIVDGANYIFQQAAALGRPAVINASVGGHFGPHDGTDLESVGLNALLNEAPGRVYCGSPGNQGDSHIHFGDTGFQQSEAWTYYFSNPLRFSDFVNPDVEMEMSLFASIDIANAAALSFAFGVDSAANGLNFDDFSVIISPEKELLTPEYITAEDILNSGGVGGEVRYENGEMAGMFQLEAAPMGADKLGISIQIVDLAHIDLTTYDISKAELWRLHIKGSGTFHVWSEDVSNIPDPAAFGITVDANYKGTDSMYSIDLPAVAEDIIAVGSYVNRSTYTDINGNTQGEGNPVGELSASSSRGPTTDGRIKPEITAPGENVIAPRSADAEDIEEDSFVSEEYVAFTGTSMSTPAAAGAIALLLQQSPNLTIGQVRETLFNNTIVDNFVSAGGSLPNNDWGYGKLDIFAALSSVVTSVKGNDLTTVETFELFQNYPNPFNPSTLISYNLPASADVELSVFNVLGQQVRTLVEQHQDAGVKKVTWDGKDNVGQSVSGGLYFFKMNAESNGKQFESLTKGILLK